MLVRRSQSLRGADAPDSVAGLKLLDPSLRTSRDSVELPLSPRGWHFPIKSPKDFLLSHGVIVALSMMLWIQFAVLVAYVYRNSHGYVPEVGPSLGEPAQLKKELSEWQAEWYECCADPVICFWSCCCPCIRWAHTVDLLNFLDYGPAFAIFVMLQLVNCLTAFLLIGAFFTMLMVYYRQKLRKVFGMPKYGTCLGYVEDCICLCFCTSCMIAQEAQHIHQAAEMGFALPACLTKDKADQFSHLPLRGNGSSAVSSSFHSFQDVHSNLSGSNHDSHEENLMIIRHSRSSSHESGREVTSAARPKQLSLGGRRQYGRTSRFLQNPTPERLLAQPPVRLGSHGEVRGTITLVQMLAMLHDDLRAYVFLFVEVGCVGHCAVSCRTLHGHIWDDRAFWHFYVGPGVNDRLAQPSVCPAAHLREAFRRWIFHIDGAWIKDLREFVNHSRQSTSTTDQAVMLSYARYIASGLMPYDNRSAVAEFAGIVCELLAEYNPRQVDARQEAEALTAQIECMGEVFTGIQIKGVISAFDFSLGRVSSSEEEMAEEEARGVPAAGDDDVHDDDDGAEQ